MDRLLITGWLFVMIGAVAIGVGGVLTTLGWNRLSRRSQMKSLIAAIAREWEINDTLLKNDPLFTATDDETLGSHRLYPRFKVSALNNALTSGLFSSSATKDQTLLRAIADYETVISDVNSRLDVSDNFVISTQDSAAISKHRSHVLQSPGFKGLLDQHQAMKDLLERNYSWVLIEKFLD